MALHFSRLVKIEAEIKGVLRQISKMNPLISASRLYSASTEVG